MTGRRVNVDLSEAEAGRLILQALGLPADGPTVTFKLGVTGDERFGGGRTAVTGVQVSYVTDELPRAAPDQRGAR